ncbi:MAG: hypothetical protein KGQ66_13160 [Acidobacteriota bacterium]|nr:hypothetical protein [Acidobacteriota bacterium]
MVVFRADVLTVLAAAHGRGVEDLAVLRGNLWCRCTNHSWDAEGRLRKLWVDPEQLAERLTAARQRRWPKAEKIFAVLD